MALLPMAVYGLEVPCGDVPIAARADIPAGFRITMAAIDPSAAPEGVEGAAPRATLKLIRAPLIDMDEEDEDSDFDPEEMDAMLADGESDEEDDSEEEVNGGPSDPAKSKKALKLAAAKQLKKELADEMDVDMTNGKGKGKGKGKVLDISEDFDDDDEDDEDDDDEEDLEPEEFVICTLDPTSHYQQTLDITIGEEERVWFVVSGTHSIYLTGNYVEPDHQHPHDDYDEYDSEDEEDYDLSPDEDELDDEDSEDALDDLENPRITEVESESEAPALVAASKKADKKGKNKRAAEESADEGAATLDDLIANASEKLSKKQQKKLKNNAGKPVAADEIALKKGEAPKGSDKKVQFAKNLEQGPTGSPAAAAKAEKAEKPKAATGIKTVNGVTIDDKKVGSGPAAKKGDRIGMRYIGKLKDGKVFDSNKKGKPFSFKLGSGEVIKGWDVGIAGMTVGGERRITVPAHLAYGSKSLPGIPGNSTLIFDVKCVEIK